MSLCHRCSTGGIATGSGSAASRQHWRTRPPIRHGEPITARCWPGLIELGRGMTAWTMPPADPRASLTGEIGPSGDDRPSADAGGNGGVAARASLAAIGRAPRGRRVAAALHGAVRPQRPSHVDPAWRHDGATACQRDSRSWDALRRSTIFRRRPCLPAGDRLASGATALVELQHLLQTVCIDDESPTRVR